MLAPLVPLGFCSPPYRSAQRCWPTSGANGQHVLPFKPQPCRQLSTPPFLPHNPSSSLPCLPSQVMLSSKHHHSCEQKKQQCWESQIPRELSPMFPLCTPTLHSQAGQLGSEHCPGRCWLGPKCRHAALGQDEVLCALQVFKANLQRSHLSNCHLVRERWWWAPIWGWLPKAPTMKICSRKAAGAGA